MILFLKEEDKIKKYLVYFNREELEKIRIEIIDKCSELVHHEYEYSGRLSSTFADDYLKIRNFKETKIGEEENKKCDFSVKKMYHYSYDELIYPYLVTIINGILNGDISSVYELLNPNFDKERKSFDERISNLNEEISNGNIDNNSRISKLNKLKKLITDKELNKNQQSVFDYYEKVRKLIVLTCIDYIDIEQFERISKFLDVKFTDSKSKPKIYELKK